MALPKLASAKYELTLPSTGEKIEFRPFLVKEEKALLIAQQSEQQDAMVRAIEDLIDVCTFGKVDAKKLPYFDMEYIFLQLRARSVGEKTEVSVLAPDDGETRVPVEIDLTTIEVIRNPEHNSKIELTDAVGMIMDYPRVEDITSIQEGDVEMAFKLIKSNVRQIYDAENVYDKNDMDEKELDEFINSMSHEQFEKVQKFFETMPKIGKKIKIKNPNTGVESEVNLEGMQSFF